MIKVGSLVRLNPKFYSITYNANPLKDYIGLVIEVEKDFYKNTISIPIFYKLTSLKQKLIIQKLISFFK